MTAPSPHDRVVVDVVSRLVAELWPDRVGPVEPTDRLDRDLGLGSLERVELLLRLEQATGARLDEQAVAEALTPRDLARVLDAEPLRVRGTAAPAAVLPAHGTLAPGGASTLVEALRWHAERTPERVHMVLREDGDEERSIAYGELWMDATAVAAGLVERGLRPAETVALLLRTERAFFQAFLGVLIAGGVPVPLYPPFRADQIEEYAMRQAAILRNAEARVLLTFDEARRVAELLRPHAPSVQVVSTVAAIARPGVRVAASGGRGGDLALIQYTSGSTGQPKGVALSHANLLANIRAYGEALGIRPDDVGVTWLPLYHDMGLIGAWLGPLFHGIPIVVMSPLAFLTRPVRWLEAFGRHRATLAAAPNFAYELCVRKISEAEAATLDLSTWRCALNGAEAIGASTLEAFVTRFGPHGFRREAMMPVYGLAEASLCVTAPPTGRPPVVDRVARGPFEQARRIERADDADRSALEFVACGRPIPGHEVRIVDAEGRRVDDRVEGRVEFRGPSAMQGYYRNPQATAAIVHDGWIDTGDLGYLADGDLYLTGRRKDVIIVGGRNLYPQEIEDAVAGIPGVRRGCVAAFGARTAAGTEQLVVAAETRERDEASISRIRQQIVARVAAQAGLPPDAVALVAPGSIPKTSSGKIRRAETRALFERGELGRLGKQAIGQWLALVAAAARWRARRAWRWIGSVLYTGWAVGCLAIVVPATWAALMLAPAGDASRRVVRRACRALLALARCRVAIDGAAALSRGPAVIVANHGSYLDALVLVAVLPEDTAFAAKDRLASYPALGRAIRQIECVLVERGRTDATEALAGALSRGRPLFVFPEGTFVRPPGLLPFRLGAFRVAVDAGVPVVPVALRGPRDIWPDETWRLTPGDVVVRVGAPLVAREATWHEMVRLRDEARAFIAEHSGESPIVARSGLISDAPVKSNP